MARFRTTARSPRSPEDVFDELADMRNAARWDPGVLGATVTAPPDGSIGLGTVFAVDLRLAGRTKGTEYRIARYDRPSVVVLAATDTTFRSTDTITVTALPGGGAEVTYDAELTPRGPWVVVGPLFDMALSRIGRRAAAGLALELAGKGPD